MQLSPLRENVPWEKELWERKVSKESFWDLLRRLGDCYEADMQLPRSSSDRARDGARCPSPKVAPAPKVPAPARENVRVPSSKKLTSLSMQSAASQVTMFEAHSCWRTQSKARAKGNPTRAALKTTESYTLKLPSFCTLSPTGHFRNFWDFLGIVLLLLDTILLPLQIVKEDLEALLPWLSFSSRMALFYWGSDIILSFFTGFPEGGTLVQDSRRIACHYLKTWFVPDFAVTMIDVVLEFSVAGSKADRATTKALRLLRLFRVVRLGKLTRFAAFLRDQFESQVASIQFSLFLVMMGMVLTEHVIACGWVGIAIFNSGATWLDQSDVKDASFVEQYTTSLRWSFSSLGIGGTNVEATNETEGVYSVVVGLISLVTFSTIVSSMTSLVSTLHSGRMEEIQQFGLLRRYLRMNKIPAPLGQRITRFLQYTYHHRESNCRDPSILGYLSTSLQSELLFAKYSPYLAKLPFLGGVLPNFLSAREEQVMQTLARTGVSIVAAAENDAIFCSGAKADTAYFAMQGSLVYMCENSPEAVNHERWVSEMCLWTDWWHVGDLLSAGIGKIAMIHATEFCHILSNMDNLQRQARCYATDYVQALNQTVDATDLWQMPEEEGTDAEQPESVWSRAFGGVHVVPA